MILNWILALVSAGLLVLLFPPFSFFWLAPVALTPLLVACAREDRWRWRLGFGYTAGVVYWFGACHWIQWTLAHHGGMGSALAWLVFVLLCLVKALQMGVFSALSGMVIRKWFAIPAIAAMWVAIEWTHSYTGFEWLNLGNAASDLPLPSRLAPITGVWGISFALALLGVTVAVLILRSQRHPAVWLAALVALYLLPDLPAPTRGHRGCGGGAAEH